MDFKLCHFYRSNTFCIHIIIKGRKLGANTQRNNGIYTHTRTHSQTAQQKYLLIKVVNSFIAAESKIDPISWDEFPYIGIGIQSQMRGPVRVRE